jgi:hypothetical protein
VNSVSDLVTEESLHHLTEISMLQHLCITTNDIHRHLIKIDIRRQHLLSHFFHFSTFSAENFQSFSSNKFSRSLADWELPPLRPQIERLLRPMLLNF